ncbi:MAG TPA: amidohydrolase family protein [Planctomycetes bacterium]|nr:amidohydrolase family protein [Planctomycetota bacterium]
MIVDCHTHVNFAADDEVAASEHLEAAERVDACIVLARGAESSEEANKKLSEYVGRHTEKMIGFAVVEASKDNTSVKNLTFITDKLGLKGAVLYCSRCGFHPTHSSAMKFYESAEELCLPVFFHNSGADLEREAILEYAQPFLLDEIARSFASLKIVIGTMGMPFVEQTLSMVAKHENVYADLTIRPNNVWQVYNMVVAAYERGVMDKLLFGSGFPSSSAGECIEALLGFNMRLADTNLPTVPRGNIQSIIERDTLALLGIKDKGTTTEKERSVSALEHKSKRTAKYEI